MFPWGAVIGAAGSVLGGLLGGKSKKGPSLGKQKAHALDYDRRRIAALVNGAKDAGIHPLVALGASGGGSFASSGYTGGGDGGQNWMSAIGPGLEAIGGLYQQDADAREEARAGQERWRAEYGANRARWQENARLAREDAIRASNESRLVDAQVRNYEAQALESEARARALGATTMNTLVGPNVASPRFGVLNDAVGDAWRTSGSSDAQDFADRYGDLAGEVFGLGNLVGDWWNSPGTYSIPLPNLGEGAILPPPIY